MSVEVLVYPNITYSRNLEADSFVVLLGAILTRLAVSRPELRFTVLLPEEVASLRLENVRQVEYALPTYPNLMRTAFDARRFLEIVDYRERSFDVVWSNLPEHTAQMKNAIYNSTDERPVFVGYSHWFEIPEVHRMAADTLDLSFAGIAAMECCGVNSRFLKAQVLSYAAERVSSSRLEEFRRKVFPQYLGTDDPPDRVRWDTGVATSDEPKLLVWNHRLSGYTGFDVVLAALERLWARRKDFRLMTTLGSVDKPYAVTPAADLSSRETYLRALTDGYLGLPRMNGQWAISVTDGLSVGLPYLLPFQFAYPEMLPETYPLFYSSIHSESLPEALERALDDEDAVIEASFVAFDAAKRLSWDSVVGSFERMFAFAVGKLSRIGDRSERYPKLRERALDGATKRELKASAGWGVGIPWTPYRSRLRDDGVAVGASTYGAAGGG